MLLMVLLMFLVIRRHCGKKWWPCTPWKHPCKYARYLAFMRHVSCTRASQLSIVLFKHVRYLRFVSPAIVLRSWCAEEFRGDVSPVDAWDKIRNWGAWQHMFLHMWILEDWQAGNEEPHMAFPTKQERCRVMEKSWSDPQSSLGCGSCTLTDAYYGSWYYRRELSVIPFI